jgi:hypothetical protein
MAEPEQMRVDRWVRMLDRDNRPMDYLQVEGVNQLGEPLTQRPLVLGVQCEGEPYHMAGNCEVELALMKRRSASGFSPPLRNINGRGAWIYLVLKEVPTQKGSTLDISVQAVDRWGKVGYDIDGARLIQVTEQTSAPGGQALQLYPGIDPIPHRHVNSSLPCFWRVTWSIAGGAFEFAVLVNQIV